MKYFIATDIHGSYFFAKKVVEEFEKSGADKLVLLGDLYYHGPRNPLPEEHAPMKVAELFNSLSDKIIAIKGNCDAEIDEMISTFPFSPAVHVNVGGERVTFTHGHYFNKDVLPIGCDLLVRAFSRERTDGTRRNDVRMRGVGVPSEERVQAVLYASGRRRIRRENP